MFSRLRISLLLLIAVEGSYAGPIDLNDFFADPTVIVATDGSSATLAEDPALGAVLLSNDPGLGDPNVILPAPGMALFFDFVFVEGAGETDEFGAFVIDVANGLSAGPTFEFFTQNSGSGSVSFDLTPLVGRVLGLQFQLSSLPGDGGLASIARVAQVRVEAVPEPSAMILCGSVLALLFLGKRVFGSR